jgi:gluconokinase
MGNGIPLTDADRWDWLIALREESICRLKAGASGVVLTCSALKRKYRDVIRIAAYQATDVAVHFIYLQAAEEVLLKRVTARQGHYMKPAMVQSQFRSLEEPTAEEADALTVDVSGSPAEVERLVLAAVQTVLAADGQQTSPVSSSSPTVPTTTTTAPTAAPPSSS